MIENKNNITIDNNNVTSSKDNGNSRSSFLVIMQVLFYTLNFLMLGSAGYLIYNESLYNFVLKGVGVVSSWWLLIPVFGVLSLITLKQAINFGLTGTIVSNLVSMITLGGTSSLGLKLLNSFRDYKDVVANFSFFEVKRNWKDEDFLAKGLSLAKNYRVSDRCDSSWIKTIYEGHREITTMAQWEEFLSPLLNKISTIKELEAKALLEGSLHMKKITATTGKGSSLAYDFISNLVVNPMFINVMLISITLVVLGSCLYFGIDGVLSKINNFFSFKWVSSMFYDSKVYKDINETSQLYDLNNKVDQAINTNLRMQAVEKSLTDTNNSMLNLQTILTRDINLVRATYADDMTIALSQVKRGFSDAIIYLAKTLDVLAKKLGANSESTTLNNIIKLLSETTK